MNALNVQPYHAMPPSSAVVVGRIVATASASNAVATTTSTSPSVRRPSGGVQIPAGSIVLVLWGSANRDECVFSDADSFDVERENVKNHMAFGNGIHFCMGAPLGRMEATIAFERLFARMTNLRFAEDRNEFRNQDAVIFRGPERLFIEFDKAG